MELGLKDSHVLITGGSRGIGLACAKAFAAEGCNVHLVARDSSQLETAKSEVLAIANVEVQLHQVDLSKSESIKELMDVCREVDVLVNNAGAIPGGSIETIDEIQWREAWDLKVFGYINMTREIYREMTRRGDGVVVNIIGMAGAKPRYDYICGSAGNAALTAFTNALGAGSTNYGVRIIGVNPTATRTDRLVVLYKARAKATFGDESRWEELLNNLPFGRLLEPEEVANFVVYCASSRASYLSGTVVNLDGGAMCR